MSSAYTYFFIAVFAAGLIGFIIRSSLMSRILSFHLVASAAIFYLLFLSKGFSVSEGEVLSYFLIIIVGILFVVGMSIFIIHGNQINNKEEQ